MYDIHYDKVKSLDAGELCEFYRAQEHSASQAADKLVRMVANSACFITARTSEGRLIGIARGMSDGIRGYLTECKLDPAFQGPGAVTATDGRIEHDHYGIARSMAQRVISALQQVGCERIDCSAYGTEVDFCEELGFRKNAGQVPMWLETRNWKESAIQEAVAQGAS